MKKYKMALLVIGLQISGLQASGIQNMTMFSRMLSSLHDENKSLQHKKYKIVENKSQWISMSKFCYIKLLKNESLSDQEIVHARDYFLYYHRKLALFEAGKKNVNKELLVENSNSVLLEEVWIGKLSLEDAERYNHMKTISGQQALGIVLSEDQEKLATEYANISKRFYN